jgi:hypothetical protein
MWLSMGETNACKFLQVNFRKFGVSKIGEWRIILIWILTEIDREIWMMELLY